MVVKGTISWLTERVFQTFSVGHCQISENQKWRVPVAHELGTAAQRLSLKSAAEVTWVMLKIKDKYYRGNTVWQHPRYLTKLYTLSWIQNHATCMFYVLQTCRLYVRRSRVEAVPLQAESAESNIKARLLALAHRDQSNRSTIFINDHKFTHEASMNPCQAHNSSCLPIRLNRLTKTD